MLADGIIIDRATSALGDAKPQWRLACSPHSETCQQDCTTSRDRGVRDATFGTALERPRTAAQPVCGERLFPTPENPERVRQFFSKAETPENAHQLFSMPKNVAKSMCSGLHCRRQCSSRASAEAPASGSPRETGGARLSRRVALGRGQRGIVACNLDQQRNACQAARVGQLCQVCVQLGSRSCDCRIDLHRYQGFFSNCLIVFGYPPRILNPT